MRETIIRQRSTAQVRTQIEDAHYGLRTVILILIFAVMLLAFSHAGLAVMSGVRHGMMP